MSYDTAERKNTHDDVPHQEGITLRFKMPTLDLRIETQMCGESLLPCIKVSFKLDGYGKEAGYIRQLRLRRIGFTRGEETYSICRSSALTRHACILAPKSEDDIDEAQPGEIILRGLFSAMILAETETVAS
jgi:hypothetical protein